MSEILLKTIIEKLDQLEKLTKDNKRSPVSNIVKNQNNENDNEEIKEVIKDMILLNLQYERNNHDRFLSTDKLIKQKTAEILKILEGTTSDHLKKTYKFSLSELKNYLIGIAIALALIAGLVSFSIYEWNTAKKLAIVDFKYRYLKLTRDVTLQSFLLHVDSNFKESPDSFKDYVIKEEQNMIINAPKRKR